MRRAAIERLLPLAYQRAASDGSVLAALLDVMETLHAPDEAVLARVDDLFTPYRSPDGLVGFLARWVAMDHVLSTVDAELPLPAGRLRDLEVVGAGLEDALSLVWNDPVQWHHVAWTAGGLAAWIVIAVVCGLITIWRDMRRTKRRGRSGRKRASATTA